MTKIRFIGDVHGKFSQYKKISTAPVIDYSIQVGDFGLGFGEDIPGVTSPLMSSKEFFIRGNHDNPTVCKEYTGYIPDGSRSEHALFFLGGADSIDKQWRTPGLDWWPDEECSVNELYEHLETYKRSQPVNVMVTHDIPERIFREILPYGDKSFGSRTRTVLDDFFEFHQPKYWFFGHHHMHIDIVVNGTRFICLNELEYFDLDLEQI